MMIGNGSVRPRARSAAVGPRWTPGRDGCEESVADIITWPVILVCPGEDELTLLADLSARRDARIVAVLDPEGTSLGAGLAEIMGLPVVARLDDAVTGPARYLVHPPLDERIEGILDGVAGHGLEIVAAREFSERVSGPRLAPPPPREPSSANLDRLLARLEPRPDAGDADLEFLELETAAIHRTLSRIEEALDREALLRWLLGLATRATGARTGSIMLLDQNAEELYVAFAYGLSQKTLHSTRVRLGDGVAGRVATTRRAELICETQRPGAERDRSELESAICAPIMWDGQVLGIINVNSSRGEAPLDRAALTVLESLTHRFGLILDRFLSIQTTSDRELLRDLEETFTRDAGAPETLATTLCAWAADVGAAAGAANACLSILTNDGDLFTATPSGTHYESPPDDAKAEVLSQGRPRVIRPGDPADPAPEGHDERTVFHLPIGRDPLRALLTLEFDAAASAHHFHTVSSEILLLLNRHLNTYLDRASTADQLDRLTSLAAALSELGAATPGPETHAQVMSAACRLTGASRALLLTGDEDLREPEPDEDPEASLAREASRLLTEAGQSGWQTTVLDTAGEDGEPRSVMVVPLGGSDPFPGLVLLDKRRLHPLDGSVFTEFDALFARRLLPLLADRLNRRPVIDTADTELLTDRLSPADDGAEPPASASEDALADILRREMDRCDRYHTMLGLAAFRLQGSGDATVADGELVAAIDRHLRSSDHTGCLEDGTILVVVPEDIQSMPRLVKRVADLLRQMAGDATLPIASASRVYPGGGDTPRKLIQSVLGALR